MKKRAVLILCIVLVASILFSACSIASSPSAVVKKYMDAAKNGDIDAMFECFEPETAELLQGLLDMMGGAEGMLEEMGFDEAAKIEYSIVGEEISGDGALVTVKVTMGGESETQDIECEKVDGVWYISSGF